MPSNPDYEDGQRSDMDKIADFLKTFAPNYQEDTPTNKIYQRDSFKEMHELERLTYEDYLQVFVPSEVEMRIQKLKQITNIIYNHLRDNKDDIINKNPYKERYNKNNDIFLHIRLTDVGHLNPGINYYDKCLNIIINEYEYDNIYIGSDNFNNILIKDLKKKYPKIIFIEKDPINTIQFGSTCKYIILSHGSFSSIIGYLGFFSNIYYPNYKPKWCPIDLFLEKGFISV